MDVKSSYLGLDLVVLITLKAFIYGGDRLFMALTLQLMIEKALL